MEEKTLVHGPLEFLFTVDEETGLTGANKLEKGVLKGKILLNLDTEEEGTFTIGCAGGADSVISLPSNRKTTASKTLYRLKISGLRGGHSGIDIHQGRANAIKLLARLLAQAQAAATASISSGSRAATNRTPSPAKPGPSWPARPDQARSLGAF